MESINGRSSQLASWEGTLMEVPPLMESINGSGLASWEDPPSMDPINGGPDFEKLG